MFIYTNINMNINILQRTDHTEGFKENRTFYIFSEDYKRSKRMLRMSSRDENIQKAESTHPEATEKRNSVVRRNKFS